MVRGPSEGHGLPARTHALLLLNGLVKGHIFVYSLGGDSSGRHPQLDGFLELGLHRSNLFLHLLFDIQLSLLLVGLLQLCTHLLDA